ncbi:MAG: DNA-binding protein WhiA [Oscillospiraceae bacterium]
MNGSSESKKTFSYNVKSEICSSLTDRDKRFACLYGISLFAKTITENEFCFQTESKVVSELYPSLFGEVFGRNVKLNCSSIEKSKRSNLYIFSVSKEDGLDIFLNTFHINPEKLSINHDNIDNNSIGIFTAGVFLSCGSIGNPEKEYHFEFAVSDFQLYKDLNDLLASIGMNFKMVKRKNLYVMYLKESESIEDMITFIGASKCTIELMNVKIYKDFRNRVNRVNNCEVANLDKTVNAAVRQRKDIELIDRVLGINSLSDGLQETARLRIENPEASLKELGQLHSTSIGRSGINHRLKKIAEIAESIRQGENNEYTAG